MTKPKDFLEINLKKRWLSTMKGLSVETGKVEKTFSNLIQSYSKKSRHYHNLSHLQAMFSGLDPLRPRISSPETVALAIWYHDYIYQSHRKDNELKSAQLARLELHSLGFKQSQVSQVGEWIEATAHHMKASPKPDSDLAYFLDLDLAILGSPPVEYRAYAQAIRKEYQHIPSFLYKKGRKQILKQFLESPRLFRTDYFYQELESQARDNIKLELEAV